MLDRLVIMEPAVGKLPELQVRKLTRKNQTHSALFIGCCEHFSAVRYVSRVQLKPGEYPPRFEGEVTEWTLQRKLGMATDKYVHGKVITASYLLEQISVTLFGAIAIFGDMLSDVYMAYSCNHKQYEELVPSAAGPTSPSTLHHRYSICSVVLMLLHLRCENSRNGTEAAPSQRADLARSSICCQPGSCQPSTCPVDARFGKPSADQKLFAEERQNVSHYGLIFVGQKLTDWKFTAKLASLFNAKHHPRRYFATFLSAYIYWKAASHFPLPSLWALPFLARDKLAVHALFVNAFCKRCVNADADKKYDITLDDYENQPFAGFRSSNDSKAIDPAADPADLRSRIFNLTTSSGLLLWTHTPRTPWPQVVQVTSSSSRCRT